jgi:hypothetical protein
MEDTCIFYRHLVNLQYIWYILWLGIFSIFGKLYIENSGNPVPGPAHGAEIVHRAQELRLEGEVIAQQRGQGRGHGQEVGPLEKQVGLTAKTVNLSKLVFKKYFWVHAFISILSACKQCMSIKGLFTRAVIFVSHSSDQFISVHVERS